MLLPAAVAASGEVLLVQVRANRVRAKQVPVPFYKRVKKYVEEVYEEAYLVQNLNQETALLIMEITKLRLRSGHYIETLAFL
jgi:hypothetical protein